MYKMLYNLMPFVILGFIGSIWGLMLLAIAGGILKACWKTALKMWRWVDRKLKSEPKAQAVDEPQAKPQPRDTGPLAEVQPNWQKTPAKIAFCKTLPTPTATSTVMPPIYYH
jgi:hypothetical protein